MRSRCGGRLHQSLAHEVCRQAQRHARAAGDQRHVGSRRAHVDQMLVGDGVDDDEALAATSRGAEGSSDRLRSLVDDCEWHEADLALRLPLQHTHEVEIAHRRQRVVLHRALGQWHVADEQVAEVDRPPVGRERRAGNGQVTLEACQQRFGDRTDVALIGQVEG